MSCDMKKCLPSPAMTYFTWERLIKTSTQLADNTAQQQGAPLLFTSCRGSCSWDRARRPCESGWGRAIWCSFLYEIIAGSSVHGLKPAVEIKASFVHFSANIKSRTVSESGYEQISRLPLFLEVTLKQDGQAGGRCPLKQAFLVAAAPYVELLT